MYSVGTKKSDHYRGDCRRIAIGRDQRKVVIYDAAVPLVRATLQLYFQVFKVRRAL